MKERIKTALAEIKEAVKKGLQGCNDEYEILSFFTCLAAEMEGVLTEAMEESLIKQDEGEET